MRIATARTVDLSRVLAELADRPVNYVMAEVGPDWHREDHTHPLGRESPGEPVVGGLFEQACDLVRDYRFAPPELIHAHYRHDAPLLGRDMLLEGHFGPLHFLMGVRVTAVLDEQTPTHTRWGWSYETLTGHLERGRLDYEVRKNHRTGTIDFLAASYSRPTRRTNPLFRLGWHMFGRRIQRRFYRRVGEQLRAALTTGTPTSAPGRRRGLSIVDPATG
ncbi:DUF1990 family protein [Actinokineospora enzanensis]|uniref:DUF1990 family protein n=1 Tax=Actinokineospora enzanensis TaxID=155975 RepID=UPI001FE1BF87|nr:DUF1990 family protein [Actinokineospora enzanensis]